MTPHRPTTPAPGHPEPGGAADTRRPVPRGLLGLLGLALAACGSPGPRSAPQLACTALVARDDAARPVRSTDTLDVIVALESRSDPLEVLARVDGADDDRIVTLPPDAPATAAGVAVTVTAPALYTVCAAGAPRAVVFQGSDPPRDKVWLRVTTLRPVRVSVRLGGDDGFTLEPALTVRPGGSGRHRWSLPEAGR